jgi:hypothetical protein
MRLAIRTSCDRPAAARSFLSFIGMRACEFIPRIRITLSLLAQYGVAECALIAWRGLDYFSLCTGLRALQAIVVLGFHAGDFFQCSFELFPIEEPGEALDILAAGKPICEH